ncbi:GntR family transcriptional regulator [Streptomyces sp. NPDC052207]|uniref:GntR family transcriptional regulator n=1 Tax=Streptomyces sp. NPDC052207 TaxID=3155418 RepID=UPI00342CA46B
MDDRRTFLSRPLTRDGGIPLRVQAHSRILDGIRSGILQPGSMVPTEAELGQLLGVSRTVVREALMLLEEDGFLVARRGIGRFVADRLPQAGLHQLRPLEDLLGSPSATPLQLQRTEVTRQTHSATFVSEELGIRPEEPTWFFETVVLRNNTPIALCQEHLAAQDNAAPNWADCMRPQAAHVNHTLLALLLAHYGPAVGAATVKIAPGAPGTSRAALLQTGPAEPAIVLTQTAALNGRPFYLAKHLVLAGAGSLSLAQTTL